VSGFLPEETEGTGSLSALALPDGWRGTTVFGYIRTHFSLLCLYRPQKKHYVLLALWETRKRNSNFAAWTVPKRHPSSPTLYHYGGEGWSVLLPTAELCATDLHSRSTACLIQSRGNAESRLCGDGTSMLSVGMRGAFVHQHDNAAPMVGTFSSLVLEHSLTSRGVRPCFLPCFIQFHTFRGSFPSGSPVDVDSEARFENNTCAALARTRGSVFVNLSSNSSACASCFRFSSKWYVKIIFDGRHTPTHQSLGWMRSACDIDTHPKPFRLWPYPRPTFLCLGQLDHFLLGSLAHTMTCPGSRSLGVIRETI
jgi:hypothetical protein